MEMPLLVTGAFQKQIRLLAQSNPSIKRTSLFIHICRFIIAEAFPEEKEEQRGN